MLKKGRIKIQFSGGNS